MGGTSIGRTRSCGEATGRDFTEVMYIPNKFVCKDT